MRQALIAGNWKMNMDLEETREFFNDLKEYDLDSEVEALICPPATSLYLAHKESEGTGVRIGGQNMYYEDSGAFTGEISPLMLKSVGADYVIIGHSERRTYFEEADDEINKKLMAALGHGITPILCVGETLEERKEGKDKGIIKSQISRGVNGLSNEEISRLVIAYEPIWAIGTGSTASSEDASTMIGYIRKLFKEMYGDCADKARILYGGSVKADNIRDFMAEEDIDGALVGGASLKAESFASLVNYRK